MQMDLKMSINQVHTYGGVVETPLLIPAMSTQGNLTSLRLTFLTTFPSTCGQRSSLRILSPIATCMPDLWLAAADTLSQVAHLGLFIPIPSVDDAPTIGESTSGWDSEGRR